MNGNTILGKYGIIINVIVFGKQHKRHDIYQTKINDACEVVFMHCLVVYIVYSDVAKETTVSKDITDTCSASPSVKKKETMAAVKTVS